MAWTVGALGIKCAPSQSDYREGQHAFLSNVPNILTQLSHLVILEQNHDCICEILEFW